VNPAHSTVAQTFTWNAAYGYEWDCFADTGLYHVGARAYDPRTARWLQRDPIDASSGDPNLYRYCGNDPVNRADPSGLDGLDDAAHFTAGWGDRLTGNLTKHIRDWLCDRLDLPHWEPRDPCDEWYLAGHLVGAVHDYALTRGRGAGGGALRLAKKRTV
jgi:RHS repeat-associated protein